MAPAADATIKENTTALRELSAIALRIMGLQNNAMARVYADHAQAATGRTAPERESSPRAEPPNGGRVIGSDLPSLFGALMKKLGQRVAPMTTAYMTSPAR